MPDDTGKNLALSDPFMRIGQWIANVGQTVQSGQVPQSVQDVFDAVKHTVNQTQTSAEHTFKIGRDELNKFIAQIFAGK
jgi:hypothetical protein